MRSSTKCNKRGGHFVHGDAAFSIYLNEEKISFFALVTRTNLKSILELSLGLGRIAVRNGPASQAAVSTRMLSSNARLLLIGLY